jgi:hypothetical protein
MTVAHHAVREVLVEPADGGGLGEQRDGGGISGDSGGGEGLGSLGSRPGAGVAADRSCWDAAMAEAIKRWKAEENRDKRHRELDKADCMALYTIQWRGVGLTPGP